MMQNFLTSFNRIFAAFGTAAFAAIALFIALQGQPAQAAADFKIVTASEKSTAHVIGGDLAKIIAPSADSKLQLVASPGSVANLRLLRFAPGVNLALVEEDAIEALAEKAAAGNAEANDLMKPLRVVLPLYRSELHYLVRADSEMNYLHDIKDAKINIGVQGSGSAHTGQAIYRAMFDRPLPEAQSNSLSNEDALIKLVGDKTIDVVVISDAQPAPLILNMKPEARKFIKLLRADSTHPSMKAVLSIYGLGRLNAASYPNLLTEDIASVTVGTYLVTHDVNLKDANVYFARFAQSICQNLSTLQALGHAKWREVNFTLPPLRPVFFYYPPTTKEFRACLAPQPANPK